MFSQKWSSKTTTHTSSSEITIWDQHQKPSSNIINEDHHPKRTIRNHHPKTSIQHHHPRLLWETCIWNSSSKITFQSHNANASKTGIQNQHPCNMVIQHKHPNMMLKDYDWKTKSFENLHRKPLSETSIRNHHPTLSLETIIKKSITQNHHLISASNIIIQKSTSDIIIKNIIEKWHWKSQ